MGKPCSYYRPTLLVIVALLNSCGEAPAPSPVENLPSPVAQAEQLLEAPLSDYESTPVGLFHRTCLRTIPDGATLELGGDVLLDGHVIRHYDRCRYKSYRSRRATRQRNTVNIIPTVNSWVEAAEASANANQFGFDWFNRLVGTTTVPSAPSSQSSQTIFFFTSLEPDTFDAILQPVLQWGLSSAGGGKRWTASVWYISSAGVAANTPAANVTTGDTIVGDLRGSCNTSGTRCHWLMSIARNGAPYISAAVETTEKFRIARKAVMEVRNLTGCHQ
jgi:hypothetical protein